MIKTNLFSCQDLNSKKFHFFLKELLNKRQCALINSISYNIQKGHGLINGHKRWIYNTANKWAERFKCSSRTIERDIKELREKGILTIRHLYPIRSVRTNCYRVNEDRLLLLYQDWQNEKQREINKHKALERMNVGIKAKLNLDNKSFLPAGVFKTFVEKERQLYNCDYMLQEFNAGYLSPKGLKTIPMSKSVAKAFNAAIKCIGLTRSKWSDLVDALRRNEWLTRKAEEKGWKLTLKNILRFKVLKRLLAGGYGIGFIDKSFGLPEDFKAPEPKPFPWVKKKSYEETPERRIHYLNDREEDYYPRNSYKNPSSEEREIPEEEDFSENWTPPVLNSGAIDRSQYVNASMISDLLKSLKKGLQPEEDMSKIIPKVFGGEPDAVKDLRKRLRDYMNKCNTVNDATYLSWFADHRIEEHRGGFIMLVKGGFYLETIKERFGWLLIKFDIEVLPIEE